MIMQASLKAFSPMIQFIVISTCFRGTFPKNDDLNAYSPILINDYGNSIFVNYEHPLKHSFPIDITPSGIIQLPSSIDISFLLISSASK